LLFVCALSYQLAVSSVGCQHIVWCHHVANWLQPNVPCTISVVCRWARGCVVGDWARIDAAAAVLNGRLPGALRVIVPVVFEVAATSQTPV
jgi:hypothetical protein